MPVFWNDTRSARRTLRARKPETHYNNDGGVPKEAAYGQEKFPQSHQTIARHTSRKVSPNELRRLSKSVQKVVEHLPHIGPNSAQEFHTYPKSRNNDMRENGRNGIDKSPNDDDDEQRKTNADERRTMFGLTGN